MYYMNQVKSSVFIIQGTAEAKGDAPAPIMGDDFEVCVLLDLIDAEMLYKENMVIVFFIG